MRRDTLQAIGCAVLAFVGFAVFWYCMVLVAMTVQGKSFECTHSQWEAGECYPQTEREYSGASDNEWYKALRQPDTPSTMPPQSCCGEADAYYADEQEIDPVDGGIIAIITDTRDDKRVVGQTPTGYTYVNRPHLAPGTKIKVPASKLRKNPSFNPTDHTIIFVSNSGYVYCYEPATLM